MPLILRSHRSACKVINASRFRPTAASSYEGLLQETPGGWSELTLIRRVIGAPLSAGKIGRVVAVAPCLAKRSRRA